MSRRPLCLRSALAALACAAPLLSPPFAHSDTCTGLSLGTPTPTAAGSTPNAVAVGDFDRDGWMDVAVLNSGSDDVSILLGDGGGGLTPSFTIGTGAGSNPVDIAAGDVDQDGILDLVVALGSTNEVRVLKGLGTGGFESAGDPFALGGTPTRIYLASFTEGDADLDLVVVDETGRAVLLYGGTAGTGFVAVGGVSPAESPSAAVPLDFNRDGKLDVAVSMHSDKLVRVYYGDGTGSLGEGPSAAVGEAPRDVAAGDVNRDGWLDLVTADSASATASVLLSSGGSSPTLEPAPAVAIAGGVPIRVAVLDLDHDGVLDLAVLDDSGTPRVAAFQGRPESPWFDGAGFDATLDPGGVRGLAVGRITADGRADLVTANASLRQAFVIENRSGTPCARSSFAGAPRSFPAGDRPVSTAAADFDEDGRTDLLVASASDARIRILLNANADFQPFTTIGLAAPPTAVATADLNLDGHADVVVARGDPGPGLVQVYLGDGTGGLTAGVEQSAGSNTSAVVVGDFDGNGVPDVAAASTGTGSVYVFLGDGVGGLAAGIPTGVGTSPRALAAGFLNADTRLDLAVANQASGTVSILNGDGDGTFTAGPTLTIGAGSLPQGIALGHLDGDGQLDVATANFALGHVAVFLGDGAGGYLAPVPYAVGTNPTAVAILDLDGSPAADIAVTTSDLSGTQALTILTNDGSGVFSASSSHSVRNVPQAITPVDADNDGLVDLAVPCSSADAVVILINRPPGPPVLARAPRVDVGDKPRAVVAGDFDFDGRLDMAVANSGAGSVSLMDGAAGLKQYATLPAGAAVAVATADFNLDGDLDLAVSAPGSSSVEIFFGIAGKGFETRPAVAVPGMPDDLVTGDFDRDGDVDIAVCNALAPGRVDILRNNGPGAGLVGTFTLIAGPVAGDKPTAIVAADFDRDGDLDLAVANDDSNDIWILANSAGSFALAQAPLALAGSDKDPLSLAAGDFDGNGTLDLVAAAFTGDRLHVYSNLGTSFATAPVTLVAPYLLQFVAAADVNLDGKTDLLAAAAGLSIWRGRGALEFAPPETVVAGDGPVAVVVGDLSRDGRPDIAVVNELSDDVSLLTSSACQAQHLELSIQPSGCQRDDPPFFLDAQVKAFDDGGNAAACATHTLTPSILPGTGDGGAVLGGGGPQSMAGGVASWTGGTALSIDTPGRRYRLQFQAGGLPPVHSRSFTLGVDATQISGPTSVCPSSSGVYTLLPDPGYDSYVWSLDGSPHSFTPTATLSNPPIVLDQLHSLGVTARVDSCAVTPPNLDVYFGNLAGVTLDIQGASTVCVDCIGGSAKAVETGGGLVVARQWGYRTVSLGPITTFPGETAENYVLKGASFPGPGAYIVVVTTTATCGSTTSNEWTVRVTDEVLGEARHLAASSRGNASTGENRLLWVNTAAPLEIRIRWSKAPDGTNDCLPPSDLTTPPNNPPVTDEVSINAPTANAKDGYLHTGLALDTAYCYSVFVRSGGGWSPGRTVKARPFDSTAGPVKWAYATGGTAVAPPTVSFEGVLAMSNDRTIHAVTRGAGGGDWPIDWMPSELAGVAHSRSPVVPFPLPLNGAGHVLFVADDSTTGLLHAVDAHSGVAIWEQPQGLPVTGAPGGMFTQFGGIRDLLVVGTRHNTTPNQLRALSVATGTLLEGYAGGGSGSQIGPISGGPAIDYATRRVYFASRRHLGTGHTLWCLEILPGGPPVFTYSWSRDIGDITGSPVLRGGRVYVGTDAGPASLVYSLDALAGGDDHVFAPADGPVRGFLFPDRRNDDLIFATDTKVWSISDDGAAMTKNWEWTPGGPTPNPSIVLYRPQTNLVYVGAANGELYELDFTNANASTPPTTKPPQVLGGGFGQVGAPSLDIGVEPALLVVGSEQGVIYGVSVPFP